jgi:hypothetical protein
MALRTINSGDLRNRLNVYLPVHSRDAGSGTVIEWALLGILYCQFTPLDDPATANLYRQNNTGDVTQYAAQRQETAKHLVIARAQAYNFEANMMLVNAFAEPNGQYRCYSFVSLVSVQSVRREVRIILKENQSLSQAPVALWQVNVDNAGSLIYDNSGAFEVSAA